jgi:hypothetical protein
VDQSVRIGKPIIGVSINYRLSLWGFASSNELASEGALNIGLRDQRLALYWVQENIKAFGGTSSPHSPPYAVDAVAKLCSRKSRQGHNIRGVGKSPCDAYRVPTTNCPL